MYLFFFLVIGIFIFLFRLHSLSKEDFVFIRCNVSLEQLFNFAILIFIISLFFSRLIYVLEQPKSIFLNPLVFLLVPYYPGLSFGGGVVLGVLALIYIARRRNLPVGRIMDFFSLSFATVLPFAFFVSAFIFKNPFFVYTLLFILFSIVSVFCNKFLYKRLSRGDIKDGVISASFFSFFSFFLLLAVSFIKVSDKQNVISLTSLILLTSLLVSSGFLLRLGGRKK